MFVQEISPFHLAFPVDDLEASRRFYGGTLGNRVARKHLGWYMDDLGVETDLRKRVQTEANTDEVLRLISSFPTDQKVAA